MAVVKAAVVHAFGQPEFSTFVDPAPTEEEHIVSMQAAALTQLVRAQAAGHHYSGGTPPFIPGVDGVGTLENGAQVYFAFPRSPFGAMAERVPVKSSYAIPVPHHLDPITAAAIANPGMSSWLALTKRAALEKGESVLVIGASGASGRLAVQIAKHLGAARVIAAARNGDAEDDIRRLGADAFITLTDNERDVVERFRVEIEHGIDVVLDYVWGPVAEAFFKAATLKRTGAAAPRIRFVNIGSMGGRSVSLSASAVRSSGLEVLGSGLGSSSVKGIIDATAAMFVAIRDARLKISVVSMPLADVEKAWQLKTSARVVLTM